MFGETWDDAFDDPRKTTFPICLDKKAMMLYPHLALLVLLQHNKNKTTPLLDVSYDIYMPLFCACGEGKENMDKDGMIFIIECLDYFGGCNQLENSELIALFNQSISTYKDRMKKQLGAMIRTGMIVNGDLCLCDISLSKNKRISKYVIPKNLKPDILKNLSYELKKKNLAKYFYGE